MGILLQFRCKSSKRQSGRERVGTESACKFPEYAAP
jgi:hypothetical protein